MAERQTLPVRGMHCAACVGKVERALTGVPGVERAAVNLATEQATVAFDPARASVPALQQAVAAAGYELGAAPVVRGGDADDRERRARAAEQRQLRRKVVIGVAGAISPSTWTGSGLAGRIVTRRAARARTLGLARWRPRYTVGSQRSSSSRPRSPSTTRSRRPSAGSAAGAIFMPPP